MSLVINVVLSNEGQFKATTSLVDFVLKCLVLEEWNGPVSR